MTLRVTHLLAPAPYGGLESVIATLAPGQQKMGHAVTLVGTYSAPPVGEPFWDTMTATDLRCEAIICPGRRYRMEMREIRRILREDRPDVVHTHGYRPDLIGGRVARSEGIATVTTVHGFTGGGWKNRLYEWLQRRAFRGFDAVVAVSERLHRELAASGVPEERLHTVPNAWEPAEPFLERGEARKRLGLSPDVPVVGWVGRFTPEKGPDVMLDAFTEAVATGAVADDAVLCMVGDGPMRPGLEEQARARGLGERVRFPGSVPGAGRTMPAFDVLALSSWTEGTPMVLLEAMAAGVPVVTTAVGGIPGVVSPAEAVLVPAGDRDRMAAALGEAVAGAPPVRHRAEAARRRLAEDFAVGPWVERYASIYQSVLSS